MACRANRHARAAAEDGFLVLPGPQSYTQDMAVSRRTVTVLFADVADSTPLGERLDPESLRRVMSRFFEQMSAVLEGHGGTVEKFIGDAVMAVFGIPELHEDDALRAVRAATELRRALSELNEQLAREFGVRIGIRVGVNTGEVVAGDGTGGQMLVTGDAVNVAKRLEEAARTGEILVGEPTRQLVENAVVLEPREELELKGKADPHFAWNVLAVIEGASAYARRLDAPLIGRDEELQTLHDAYADAVASRTCLLFTLVGPAGIGKSRLATELCGSLRDEATTLSGRCLPYGDGITFWPLVEIIGALGSDEGVREAVAKAEDGELVAAGVLGAVGSNAAATPGSETFWAVRRLFEEIARDRPLVVLVEDIHWAEPTLLDFLEYLARWTHDAPILLLCLARPDLLDERPGWLTQNGGGVLLQPLTEDESRALLDEIGHEWPLDAAARERITEAAEGNPLYLEQMAAMLAEGGPMDAIPPSIHALIAARLDRLPSPEREVLESAAVAGKHFVRSALRRLLAEADQAQVDATLLNLARKDLLAPRPGREDAYRFRHVLIRDAAYAGIPKERRSRLHERFAEWATQTGAGRAGDVDEIIGYHLEQAFRYREQLGPVDPEASELAQRAAEILGTAGRRAFARDDAPAAVNLLDRALALATDEDPAQLELMRQLSSALWSVGEVARAETLLNGLLEAASAAGNRRYELYGALQQSAWRAARAPETDWEEAVALADKAIPVFEELGDDVGLAQAWRHLGMALGLQSRFADSVDACERALAHARRGNAAREESRAADLLCMGLLHGPSSVDDAIARANELLEGAANNPLLQSNVLAAVAELKAMQGAFDEARAMFVTAQRNYEKLGLRLALAGLMQVGGLVELLAGDPVAAERFLREGYAMLVGVTGWQGMHGLLLAEALHDQERYPEADELVDAAEALHHSDELDARVAWAGRKAPLLARDGEHEEAESLIREALASIERTDALNLHARTLAALAEVLLVAGRAEASAAAKDAIALFKRKGNTAAAERAAASLLGVPARR
jgi:class 3 adenylate cyclase/tetratricopeptide (TPR) repeat protein